MFVLGSVLSAYTGAPVETPRPRRWPGVKRQKPSWRPSSLPCSSTTGAVRRLEPVAGEEVAVVAAGQEACLLALTTLGCSQAGASGLLARLLLALFAEREPEAGEPPGIEAGEHVRLILGVVGRAREQEHAVPLDDSRVMAGSELGRADPTRKSHKLCEPEAAVAAYARVRCLASSVTPDERCYDRATELVPEVEREVREVKTMARIASRGDGRRRAAHSLGVGAAGIRPEPERDADGLEAFVAGPQERNCAVDTAAHGDGNTPLAGGCDRSRSEGVVQGLGSEPRRRHGCGFEHRKPPHGSAELRDSFAFTACIDDSRGCERQTNPGEIGVRGCMPDQFNHGAHRIESARMARWKRPGSSSQETACALPAATSAERVLLCSSSMDSRVTQESGPRPPRG